MKNTNHLFVFANVLARLLVRLSHLVTALNTFNNIDIVLAPDGQ